MRTQMALGNREAGAGNSDHIARLRLDLRAALAGIQQW